ncbi:MAG: hypothetical protein QOD28_2964 [Acidobacteriota bacterium]|nr:hypothetical protein [Acidobacteriota bacterium]
MLENIEDLQRVAVRRLEEFDFLQVNSKLREYCGKQAAKIHVVIPDYTSAYGSFIDIKVEIDDLQPVAERNGDGRLVLFSISVDWPPLQTAATERRPISVLSFSTIRGDVALRSATLEDNGRELMVTADSADLAQGEGPIVITLSTPSLYFLLPGSVPFQRHLLHFNLSVPTGVEKCLLHLDHSSKISLRCRKDNSEYQSLAYSTQSNYVRKITFFPQDQIKVRYYYGTNDDTQLIKVGSPLFAGGLSLLAGSLTIALINANLLDSAATTLALLILPPFLQLFPATSVLYPSSDISRFSVKNIIIGVVAALYVPLAVLSLLTLVRYPQFRPIALRIDLLVGSLLIIALLIYMILINQGVLQHYACDRCERRIWRRHKAKLNLKTRQTLCRDCWHSDVMPTLID